MTSAPRAWAAYNLARAAYWRSVGDKGFAVRYCVKRAVDARKADEAYVALLAEHDLRLFRP